MELGPVTGAALAEPHRFPCPSCGADLRYAPDLDRLKCAHCGHEEAIPEHRGPIPELDLRAVERGAVPHAEIEELRIAQCPSCGAQIEFDADLHAKECPFCASPIVTDTGVQRQIKPQAQLPFLLTEAQAREAMNRWLGRLWFAPSDLKEYARAERAMQGIYVPYWTYDAETRSRYAGQRGTVYHESRPVHGDRQRPAADPDAAGGAGALAAGARPGGARASTTCWCSARPACRSTSPTRSRPGTCRRSRPTSRASSPASAPRATPCRSRRPTARRARS